VDDTRSDEELFEGWLIRQDTAGFNQLYQRYRGPLRGSASLALRAAQIPGFDEVAEDCVQETFQRLAVQRQLIPCVRAWLFRVLRTRVIDALRRANRGPRVLSTVAASEDEPAPLDPADTGLAPLEELIDRETPTAAEVVRPCLEALPDNFREVIVMHYLEDRSYKAITAATGLSHNTIAMRLHRARGVLEECVRKRLSVPE
jgi:RNA polymerase sigma-70 factor (ECF subfamily)